MKWSEMKGIGKVCCVFMFISLIGSIVLSSLGIVGTMKDGTRYGAMLFCYALCYMGLTVFKKEKTIKILILVMAGVIFLLNALMLLV